jgi:hypothetical protein
MSDTGLRHIRCMALRERPSEAACLDNDYRSRRLPVVQA